VPRVMNNAKVKRAGKKGKRAFAAGRSTLLNGSLYLRRSRFHLVAHRFLGGQDDFGRAALGFDFFDRRFGEAVGLDGELLGEFAVAQDADAVGRTAGQAGFGKFVGPDDGAVGKVVVEVADVDDVEFLVPGFVAEAALGDLAEQGHLAAFVSPAGLLGARAG